MAEWDDEIDSLYDLEPGEFVAARNALVKRIRAGGDKERAGVVAKLGRPSLVAWALNRAVRDEPERVEDLVEATARLTRAQADLMAGGDRDELRAATAERRAVAGALVTRAVGHAGPAQTDAIRNTLDAALADPGLLERLRAGTLAETLDAPALFGFDIGADSGPAAPTRARAKGGAGRKGGAGSARDARSTEGAKARGQADDAGDDGAADEQQERARADAEATVATLEAEVAASAGAAEVAATDLEEADDEVREAEDALTAARLARTQAADAAAAAQADHDRLTARLEEARRLLDELSP